MLNQTNDDTTQNPNSPKLTLKIVWFALLMSQFIYGYVLFFIGHSYSEEVEPFYKSNLFVPFVIASVAMYFTSLILPNVLIKNRVGKLKKSIGSSEKLLSNKVFIVTVFTATIVRLALLEAITIFGFVLSFTSHEMTPFYLFGGFSIINYGLNFPSENYFRKFVEL